MISARSIAFFALACVPALVQAHGAISEVVSGGETYVSPKIGQQGKNGPFWVIDTSDPVTNLDSKDMICGPGASKRTPSEAVKVAAGETVQVSWGNGFQGVGSKWPHKFGPMIAYMAKCSSDDCKDITDGGAKWFKISQEALKDGRWKQEDIFNGQAVGVTIPNGLEPGSYVVRHELTNLAIATAELYPGCFRAEVTGNGNQQLSGESASFPGAYSTQDAGLKMTGTGELFGLKDGYKFSGPDVVELAAGVSSSSEGAKSQSDKPADDKKASDKDTGDKKDSDKKPDTKKDTGSTTSGKAASGAVNNAGAAPEEDVAADSSAAPTEPSAAPEETEPETDTEDEATPAPAPAADESGANVSTSSYEQCNQAFLECNDKWQGTDLTGSYSCQTEFVTCVSSSPKAKRMHRARRGLNRLHSPY